MRSAIPDAAEDGHEEERLPFIFPGAPIPPTSSSQSTASGPRTQFEVVNAVEDKKKPSNIKRRLFLSHFLSTWNSRVFEFGAILVLAEIYQDSLLAASLYAFVRAASAICFSPMIGRFIDRKDRLKVVRRSIIGQRTAVLLSCPGFALLGIAQWIGPPVSHIIFVLIAVLACVEKLCSIMNLNAIERDWVVVIAENSHCPLDELNSQMRRIDLICKLFGPLLIALINAKYIVYTLEVMFGTNVLSLLMEYFAIADVYRMVPALQSKQEVISSIEENPRTHQSRPIHRMLPTICIAQVRHIYDDLSDYSRHAAFLPSMALCLSYLTVLSFSGQMVSYLVSIGLRSDQIGGLRTLSTAVEISATWLAPLTIKRVGPIRSGLWFINWKVICLLGAVSSFWVIHKPLTAALFMVAGMIASRIGLWGFDLSVQTIVQEEVESHCRGSFSSRESSLQNFFELCSYGSTMVFARPDQFRYPVSISVVAVLVADGLYAEYVRKNRGHLLHLSSCLEGKQYDFNRQRDDVCMQDLP